jgi:pSer/pThr/pTyr-binding forkhead associated (FHA) protein
MPRLIAKERGKERALEFDDEKITIGRSSDCSVVISDPTASRIHCTIEKTKEGFLLSDLGSKNGTLLNGKQVERKILAIGDIIEIGEAVIVFERSALPSAAQAQPATAQTPIPAHATGLLSRPQVEPKPAGFTLVIISGPDTGREFPVGDQPVTIGRRRMNAVPLSDEKASGVHARISKEGDLYLLTDLGSTNGTCIGSRRIEREVISHNSLFTVGDTTLLFKQKRPEEALSTGQGREIAEEESEFAEVDLVRALKEQKRSPVATFLYSVAAVFLILSILYFGFVIFGRIFRAAAPEFPSASLISTNWSFEQERSDGTLPGWLIREKGWSIDHTIKRSGKRSLLFDCSSCASDEGMEAKYETPITTKPQTDYLIRVCIKTEDILRCGVKLTWTDERNKEFRRDSYTCLVSGSTNLSQVKGIVSPPQKATQFEICLFALGNKGKCWFDNIEVEEQPAQPELARSRTMTLGDKM